MFGDILPKDPAVWALLLGACLIGIVMGTWIRRRRERTTAEHAALVRLARAGQKKRLSKKERVRARRLAR